MDNKKESLVKLNLRGQEFLLNKSAYSVDKMSKLSSVITSKGSGDMQPGSQIYLDRNPALFQYILGKYKFLNFKVTLGVLCPSIYFVFMSYPVPLVFFYCNRQLNGAEKASTYSWSKFSTYSCQSMTNNYEFCT